MFRYFDEPGRVLDPVMRPLKKGDAMARWLPKDIVVRLEWACKGGCDDHWFKMPVPASMASTEKLVEILLQAAKPTNLPSCDIPASMSADPEFVTRAVVRAVCFNCVAGKWGACWHIACLLFVLRYLVRGGDVSPTSKLCRWIMPSAKWLIEPSRQIPLSQMLRQGLQSRALSEVPRKLWFMDQRMVAFGGRSAIALPPTERSSGRDHPDKVRARAHLYDIARNHFHGEPCIPEWVYDTPTETLSQFRDQCTQGRRKKRAELLSGSIVAGLPTVAPSVPSVSNVVADPIVLLANAAKYSSMSDTELRQKCYVHAQHFPEDKMPSVAGGTTRSKDYAKQFMCPWHGFIEDRFHSVRGAAAVRSHFTPEGVCRDLGSLSGDDIMTYWLERWNLPGPGQSYQEVNPEAAAAAMKRKQRRSTAK